MTTPVQIALKKYDHRQIYTFNYPTAILTNAHIREMLPSLPEPPAHTGRRAPTAATLARAERQVFLKWIKDDGKKGAVNSLTSDMMEAKTATCVLLWHERKAAKYRAENVEFATTVMGATSAKKRSVRQFAAYVGYSALLALKFSADPAQRARPAAKLDLSMLVNADVAFDTLHSHMDELLAAVDTGMAGRPAGSPIQRADFMLWQQAVTTNHQQPPRQQPPPQQPPPQQPPPAAGGPAGRQRSATASGSHSAAAAADGGGSPQRSSDDEAEGEHCRKRQRTSSPLADETNNDSDVDDLHDELRDAFERAIDKFAVLARLLNAMVDDAQEVITQAKRPRVGHRTPRQQQELRAQVFSLADDVDANSKEYDDAVRLLDVALKQARALREMAKAKRDKNSGEQGEEQAEGEGEQQQEDSRGEQQQEDSEQEEEKKGSSSSSSTTTRNTNWW